MAVTAFVADVVAVGGGTLVGDGLGVGGVGVVGGCCGGGGGGGR